ncbi:MAG: radical SAM protein [Candidatus Kuenenbacteria bacterium]
MTDKSFYGFREKSADAFFQSFALEIVAGCQLQCENCYKDFKNGLCPMPESFVKRMIHEAGEVGFSEIVLIGGEPTLHPGLPEFIEWTLEAGLSPIVCTNGMALANKNYCEKIALPNTTIVIHGLVPLPSTKMDEHVKFTGYADKLQEAYHNINTLRTSRDITVVAEAVVIKPFLPYLLEFHKWCRENDYIPFIELNRRKDNGQESELSVSPEELCKTFKVLQNWDKQNAAHLTDQVLSPPAYGTKCTMSITGIHVKNFGNNDYGGVYSCCAQTIRHGDLRKQSLGEIIYDPSMAVFKNQDQWIAGPCKTCKDYPACKGGCRGEATLAFGCPRSSCPACWRIPEKIRNDPNKMMPESCIGCPLEGKCTLRRE